MQGGTCAADSLRLIFRFELIRNRWGMGDGNFKISVAMCTHNAERLVEAQLESILNQTRPPDEVVICDDVSTDRTIESIRRIGQNNPALRLVQNPEKLGVRRNFSGFCTSRRAGLFCPMRRMLSMVRSVETSSHITTSSGGRV